MAKEILVDVQTRLLPKEKRSARETVPEGLFKRETYKCPELGRTCHRPGAYDAFDLPSIIGQERRLPNESK